MVRQPKCFDGRYSACKSHAAAALANLNSVIGWLITGSGHPSQREKSLKRPTVLLSIMRYPGSRGVWSVNSLIAGCEKRVQEGAEGAEGAGDDQ